MKVSSHFDQYLAAGIFPPFPPSRCASDSMRAKSRHFVTAAVTFVPRQQPAAVVGYAVHAPAERISHQKRHRLTTAKLDALSLGATDVLS